MATSSEVGQRSSSVLRRTLGVLLAAVLMVASANAANAETAETAESPDTTLLARAVLPGATFAEGPPSGRYLGGDEFNGVPVPFENQPVQGISALLPNGDGTYWLMSDNGFGSIENSADYNLRVYLVRPNYERADGSGDGSVEVLDFIELADPDGHIPFAIVNHFTSERTLTGADFDIESIRIDDKGDIWIGDEFGPFLLHFDGEGRLLEAPIPLPDFVTGAGGELRAPQNPYNEEFTTLRVMNAVRTHAQLNGNDQPPVVSPWHVMIDDGDETTVVGNRQDPGDSGLAEASSEIHNISSIQRSGYPFVPYTINDAPRMVELFDLEVDGIISDSPDVLYQAIADYDADGDGTPGDWILEDGRIDASVMDAQGHRGARNLRPENTLPGMEAALDYLMTTLETDTGVSLDGISMLDHDPAIEAGKCRRADGAEYGEEDEVFVRDLTAAEIQSTFICDRILDGRPDQTNDLSLSPVSVAFAAEYGLIDPYVMPTVEQLFQFVEFYEEYYRNGAGSDDPRAEVLADNAAEVRFNIETKINPREEFAERTLEPQAFVDALAGMIEKWGLESRADIQSFDWRSLLLVHEQYPAIRTVFLFGDFPLTPAGGDGTNLQDEFGANTPWLADLYWPYRVTELSNPRLVPGSGGFEGMALSLDGQYLYPMLERPLVGSEVRELIINEFDIEAGEYTGNWWTYPLDEGAGAIGDFTLYGANHGVVIERDGSQGDLDGLKRVYAIELGEPGTAVSKTLVIDLLDIADPAGISLPAEEGDVGLGDPFAMPFVTIESVIVYDETTIGITNDNNFPFSVGRHVGQGRPDDNEFIIVGLAEPLPGFGDPDRKGTLTGEVTAGDGAPAGGVVVDLFEDVGGGVRGQWLGDTTTDADGDFTFEVDPGSYVLTFIAPDGDTFTNGARWLQLPASVEAGGTTGGLDAQLVGDGTGLGSISGMVAEADGKGAEGVVVDLFVAAADGSRARWLGDQTTDEDGAFTFDAVAPGCYVLTFIAPDGQTFTNGSQWFQPSVCVAAGEAVTGLDAELS